ncbi:MAG: amidohydrolase family protein [Oscillospiraceae bacterium]
MSAAVTMDPARPVLQNACVAVEGTRIASVGQEHPRGEFDRVIDGQGKSSAARPGQLPHPCTHGLHAPGHGMGSRPAQHWLNDYIFPAYEPGRTLRCVAAGTALGLAEMIASGTTCIADMYMHTGAVALDGAGVRRQRQPVLRRGMFRRAGGFSPDARGDRLEPGSALTVWAERRGGRARSAWTPPIRAECTSSPSSLWSGWPAMPRSTGLGMHVHVSETRSTVQVLPPKIWQDSGGPVGPVRRVGQRRHSRPLCLGERRRYGADGQRNITAVHNPVSNLKLASGAARVPRLLERGVNVALGTDGVASNNSHDLFGDQAGRLCSQGSTAWAAAMTARRALEMATINGARALRRATGVIARAKNQRTTVLVDLALPNLFPCRCGGFGLLGGAPTW